MPCRISSRRGHVTRVSERSLPSWSPTPSAPSFALGVRFVVSPPLCLAPGPKTVPHEDAPHWEFVRRHSTLRDERARGNRPHGPAQLIRRYCPTGSRLNRTIPTFTAEDSVYRGERQWPVCQEACRHSAQGQHRLCYGIEAPSSSSWSAGSACGECSKKKRQAALARHLMRVKETGARW